MQRRSRWIVLMILVLGSWAQVFSQEVQDSADKGMALVGNVHGTVTDATTGSPIAGAEIVLVDKPVSRQYPLEGFVMPSNKGMIALPMEITVTDLRILSDANGEFLISGVPTPFPFKPYTVVVSAAGYDQTVIDYIPVLPGAVMSLKISFALSKNKNETTVYDGEDGNAPIRYGREGSLNEDVPASPESVDGPDGNAQHKAERTRAMAAAASPSVFSATVFATQEGLIGMTTANGHKIQKGDNFVALPSVRALCSKEGSEYQVKVSYKNLSVTAPVWDVGPWNEHDDYWNPKTIRELWQDLAQGMPEAQAAYQTGYNKKKDQRGRVVPNSAGIDLGSGTVSTLGLKNLENVWVAVQYLWTTGNGDFSITPSATEISAIQGSPVAVSLTVKSIDGFGAPQVALSVSGQPSESSVSFSKDSVWLYPKNQPSVNLNVNTTSKTSVGKFTLTIVATVGQVTRKATVSLTVTAKETVSTPTLKGPISGFVSTALTFSASGASSSKGNGLVYTFNWGDGTQSSGGSSMAHSWSSAGKYSVQVRAASSKDSSVTSSLSNVVSIQVDWPPLTSSCAASPNPVKVNKTVTWQAKPTGGSGSYSYSWLNGTTTVSYSKTYTSASKVDNWVIITDKQTNKSVKGSCQLTVTK